MPVQSGPVWVLGPDGYRVPGRVVKAAGAGRIKVRLLDREEVSSLQKIITSCRSMTAVTMASIF